MIISLALLDTRDQKPDVNWVKGCIAPVGHDLGKGFDVRVCLRMGLEKGQYFRFAAEVEKKGCKYQHQGQRSQKVMAEGQVSMNERIQLPTPHHHRILPLQEHHPGACLW